MGTKKRSAREVKYTVYSFDELSDEAKQKALDNLRDINVDDQWWDFIYEGFKEDMSNKGVDVDDIYFSGFSSQGDGASFTGTISSENMPKFMEVTGLDKQFPEVYEYAKKPDSDLDGKISQSGRHSHEGTMSFDLGGYSYGQEDEPDLTGFTDAVLEELRSDAKTLYSNLESAYENLTSDEAVKETILSNDYEFEGDGSMKRSKHGSKEEKDIIATLDKLSGKVKKAYRGSQEIFKNRHDYEDALIEFFGGEDIGKISLFDQLVLAMGDDEAFENFDYIARMNDIYFTEDGRAVDSETYREEEEGDGDVEASKEYKHLISTLDKLSGKKTAAPEDGNDMPEDLDFNEETVKAQFAKEFDVSEDDIEVSDSSLSSFGETVYEVSVNGEEYTVVDDEETAERLANAVVKQDLEDEPEIFNQDWLSRQIDSKAAESFFRDIYDEMNQDYVNNIESESSRIYTNRLAEEMVERGIITEEEGEDDEFDLEDKKDEMVEQITQEQIDEGNGGYDHYAGNIGEEEARKLVLEHNLIDIDSAAEDAVATDGWQYFLSRYDGDSSETPGGFVYWREN